MNNKIIIRDVLQADHSGWLPLWSGYNAFYQNGILPEITDLTWQRILNPDSAIFCRVAEHEGHIAGFAHCVVHESTWADTPYCYLEDLYVDPSLRGKGIGRELINDLIALVEKNGWSRLYWHTRENNPARKLYNEFAVADGFVRYKL